MLVHLHFVLSIQNKLNYDSGYFTYTKQSALIFKNLQFYIELHKIIFLIIYFYTTTNLKIIVA